MYTITFKDGRKTIKTNDAVKVVAIIQSAKVGEYEIIETAKQPAKQRGSNRVIDENKEREAFIATLTPSQYNDVQTGVKEVRYTSKLDEDGNVIGWHLKFNAPTKEIHTSVKGNEDSRREVVKKAVKSMIANSEEGVREFMQYFDVTDEEFDECFNKLIS